MVDAYRVNRDRKNKAVLYDIEVGKSFTGEHVRLAFIARDHGRKLDSPYSVNLDNDEIEQLITALRFYSREEITLNVD